VHDPLSSFDLVHDEIDQRRETGHDVSAVEAAFAETDPSDRDALEQLLLELSDVPRSEGWAYEEPDALDGILDTLPAHNAAAAPDRAVVDDKIAGGWLGRIAGCNLGKPIEHGEVWTTGHIRAYLDHAGAWPLLDYIPKLDPMPDGFELLGNWPETTRGNVDGSARDDDIDYPILGLHLLEQHGASLSTHHVADGWLYLLPYYQVYTAERAAYTNLIAGVPLEAVAATRNPYREWIGALIRGDVFGWVSPGRPRDAMALAFQDAALSHVANGIYGELWSAALVSSAFLAGNAREAVEMSLEHVPPRSRLHEALSSVIALKDAGSNWEQAVAAIQRDYGHYSWVHTINNAAIIVAGLLWGDDDYSATVGLTVAGGWDTDSNGATAGSVSGVLHGAAGLPQHFVAPLHDRTRSALFGFDNSAISDLAARTSVLAHDGLRPGS
jgi:ADP-ribosylglycohydrolase